MRRCLIGIAALLLTAAAGLAPAAAGGLCGRLTLPALLELACTDEIGVDGGPEAVIAPIGGTFSALSRMSVRELDRASDPLAWSDPADWLEGQMIVDLDGVGAALQRIVDDPDSPFGSSMISSGVASLVRGLEDLSRLPLAACGDGATPSEVTCRFGVEPISLVMKVLLIEDREARFAVNIRTFNEQRLRHFTAVANSFRGG